MKYSMYVVFQVISPEKIKNKPRHIFTLLLFPVLTDMRLISYFSPSLNLSSGNRNLGGGNSETESIPHTGKYGFLSEKNSYDIDDFDDTDNII